MTTKEAQQNVEPPVQQQQPAQQQQQPISGKRIIVRNLPVGVTKEELRELGDRYGRVVSVQLVANPQKGSPFGFISFLTEDDAEYSIYRLHDFYYKGEHLSASFPKPNPNATTTAAKPKPGARANQQEAKKDKKKNTQYYSLRSLTPLNPPSLPPQTSQGAHQAPKAWDQPAPAQVTPSHQPAVVDNNGYVQGGKGKQQQGRKNNNNNNNSNNSNRNRKQTTTYKVVPEIVEDVPTESSIDSYPANVVHEVPVVEVSISIESTQQYLQLKLTEEQLQDFYKAVEPFLPPQ